MGGCGEAKLSDEANAMKWKILQNGIHLGGLSKDVSNMLIQRGLDRRSSNEKARGYVDSLLQWSCEMGLQLYMHQKTPLPHFILRIRQMLSTYDPLAIIAIHTDGSLEIDKNTPIIDQLMLSPLQMRRLHGKGRTGIYIKGTLLNGNIGQIGVQLQYKLHENIYTTPFLQELIGIIVGNYVFHDQGHVCHAYTDCKSALTRVQDILYGGAASTLHLSYGSILNAISTNNSNYSIQWTESHPENKKRNVI
jgi:hypothetical protein